jgi:hypothetical protein
MHSDLLDLWSLRKFLEHVEGNDEILLTTDLAHTPCTWRATIDEIHPAVY